jgi:hypothetical protein
MRAHAEQSDSVRSSIQAGSGLGAFVVVMRVVVIVVVVMMVTGGKSRTREHHQEQGEGKNLFHG